MLHALAEEKVETDVVIAFLAVDEEPVRGVATGGSHLRLRRPHPGGCVCSSADPLAPSRVMTVLGKPLFEQGAPCSGP